MSQTSKHLSTRRNSVAPSRDECGATAVEYALMLSLIGAIVAGAVAALGNWLIPVFTDATTWF
jgi:Flp pilus assembly pilin Flp